MVLSSTFFIAGRWAGIAEPRAERRPPSWPLRPRTACHRAPQERRLTGPPRGPKGRSRNRERAGDQAQPASHGAAGARPGASLRPQESCSPGAGGVSWAEEKEARGPRRRWPEKQRSGSGGSCQPDRRPPRVVFVAGCTTRGRRATLGQAMRLRTAGPPLHGAP